MKKYIFVMIVLVLISTVCLSKTGLGAFGAVELPGGSPVWIGATLRSIGGGLFGFEIAAMMEQEALAAADFTTFQIMPALYLCVPIGESLTVYAGGAPIVYVLGTKMNFEDDAFYVRGGVQFTLGQIDAFLSTTWLFFIQNFAPSNKFGMEGGLTFNF